MPWDETEMDRHSCPVCGTGCPPRPPLHGPPVKDAVFSLSQQLAEPHEFLCPMEGYAGNFQGYVNSQRAAHCACRMRYLYHTRLKLQRIFDEPEE